MPKLPRKTVVQFGASGPSTDFGQFGSEAASAPQTSKDPTIIQQLAAWGTGWAQAAIGAAFNPFLEDMNGFCFVVGYFLANIFERGIPDWDAGTTYFRGAYVQDPAGSGQRWYSLQDANLNNAPPLGASNAFWHWDNPTGVIDGGLSATKVPKVSIVAGLATLINGLLSDDGTDVIIGGVAGTNALKFPDGTRQLTAAVASWPTTQRVVTGSRVPNAVYQNTTGKALYVTITTSFTGSNGFAYTDANPAPSTVVAASSNSNAAPDTQALTFIVLPGNYYKFDNSFAIWTEWY